MSGAVAKKRLVFCTYSSVYSSIVLKRLLADDTISVVAIINSTRLMHSHYGFVKGAFAQIKASGLRYASYLFLVTDVSALLKPTETVNGLAKTMAIPVLSTNDINSSKALDFIQSYQPDVLLAAHFNQLIKSSLLNFFKGPEKTCLNIHPSLLPDYKGVDPAVYMLLANDKAGVSLHKMAESFDTGEILLQQQCSIEPADSVFSLNCKLFNSGAGLALEWIHNPEKSIRRENKEGCYDSWPSKQQINQLRNKGRALIKLPQLWKQIFSHRQGSRSHKGSQHD